MSAVAGVDRLATRVAEVVGPARTRARALAELGDLRSLLQDYAAAVDCYGRAVELDPGEVRYRFNRAAVRRFTGDLSGAEADYDEVIAATPGDAQAWLNRSELRVQTPARNHIAGLERALKAAQRICGPEQWRLEVPLRYALAKEYEDVGQYEDSWRQLAEGAALRRRHLSYDPRVDLATVDWIREAFPASRAASESAAGCPSAEPIFIVGMPRTGSTLVDRIVGGHAQVFPAGELPHFSLAVVSAVERTLGSRPDRRGLVAASASVDAAALGADYLRRTRPRTGHTQRFTDKLPINYLYCGLIARALPEAPIVHVTRHPMATCHSVFKVLFDQGYPFSYDLEELAQYYIGYRRLMQHWEQVLPGRILKVAYEDLVANPGAEARRLIEALGLPWQPDCVDFVRNATPVATASAAQVRRPLYDSSIGLWRRYEHHLAPVRRRLAAAGIEVS